MNILITISLYFQPEDKPATNEGTLDDAFDFDPFSGRSTMSVTTNGDTSIGETQQNYDDQFADLLGGLGDGVPNGDINVTTKTSVSKDGVTVTETTTRTETTGDGVTRKSTKITTEEISSTEQPKVQ